MKNCSNCFCANSDEAELCHECGTKFPVWAGAEPLPPLNQTPSKSKVSMGVVLIWIIVIALLAAFFLFWLFAAGAASGMSDT
jgi:uncharacterized membrane protein YvbJ